MCILEEEVVEGYGFSPSCGKWICKECGKEWCSGCAKDYTVLPRMWR